MSLLQKLTSSWRGEKMCNEKCKYSQAKMDEVNAHFDNLICAIDAFNGKKDEPINRDSLLKFEIGKWYDLNDKVKIRRRQNRFKTYLNFDTVMKEGGEFGKHFHEDVIESCEILSGSMVDLIDGRKYISGDVMHYDKGIKHTPIAEKDTELHVLFKA